MALLGQSGLAPLGRSHADLIGRSVTTTPAGGRAPPVARLRSASWSWSSTRGEIAAHELRADQDEAEARALQLWIVARVRARLAHVNGSIDLDDELDAERQQVSGEER
jgi:hypothetical protein